MARIQLIHWKPAEAEPRIRQLEAAGHEVLYVPPDPQGTLRHLRDQGLEAIVIDLTRSPSHGREVGRACRMSPSLRPIPLIYVDGEPEKVDLIKKILPDASYTGWSKIRSAIKQALRYPVEEPVRPIAYMETFHNKPLWKKLGIKPNDEIALLRAPEDFLVDQTPDGVRLVNRIAATTAMAIWFVRSQRELMDGLELIVNRIKIPLWIAWPKQASKLAPDLSFPGIRAETRKAGLRESKVCAIDQHWSSMRLSPPDRSRLISKKNSRTK